MAEKIWRVTDQWTESREMELAEDDKIGTPRMVTLLMVILLVIGDIRTSVVTNYLNYLTIKSSIAYYYTIWYLHSVIFQEPVFSI